MNMIKRGWNFMNTKAPSLAAIDAENRLNKTTLRTMFTGMIAALQKKMAGFSRRETNMYYLSIMNKAWEQIKNSPRDKLPGELAASLEWLALDPEYENKLGPYTEDALFSPGSRDYWYHRFPQRTASTPGATMTGKGYGQTVSGAANRFVQSLQVFSGALLGESAAFTSAITKVTNPPPVAHVLAFGRPWRQQLRLRLRLRRLRLRLRRRRPMKNYSMKKAIAPLLVSLAAAAFAAAAAAQLFSRGHFLALRLGASRYQNANGLLPALLVFLAVMFLLAPLLLRAYARTVFRTSRLPACTIITTAKNSAPSAFTCAWKKTGRPS